nr:helix-turn-helix domain-containing protein [Leucobacter exalbidus]
MSISPSHRELLDQVLDKWSLAVLSELCDSPKRFNELRRAITDVSQKSLTNTLRRLERNGVVDRHVLSSRPVAIRYEITPLGKSMRAPIDELLSWAATNMSEINRARDQFDETLDNTPAPGSI